MNKKIKIENTFNLNNLILPTIMIKAFIDSWILHGTGSWTLLVADEVFLNE